AQAASSSARIAASASAGTRGMIERRIEWSEAAASSVRRRRGDDARQPRAALGAIRDLPRELSARGGDVVASRLANSGDEAGVDQDALERDDALPRAHSKLGPGERIERNQVELARNVLYQCGKFAS